MSKILIELNISLCFSTYQANRVVFLSGNTEGGLRVYARKFYQAMGIAHKAGQMAIGTHNDVQLFRNSPDLGKSYKHTGEANPDAFFHPTGIFFTGKVDLHDLHFGKNALWGVNTAFSCVCKLDGGFSWEPVWFPPFVPTLAGGDACHLNGLAMDAGMPRFVTALSATSQPGGWRENLLNGGVLMDFATRKVISEGLAMPHSPRMVNGELMLLLSAAGQLARWNPTNQKVETLLETGHFVRGLAHFGKYLFIGISKIRPSSTLLDTLPIAATSQTAGILVYDRESGAIAGRAIAQDTIEEIYDIQVLPGVQRPAIIHHNTPGHSRSIAVPGESFVEK